jgi:hypothetical protein
MAQMGWRATILANGDWRSRCGLDGGLPSPGGADSAVVVAVRPGRGGACVVRGRGAGGVRRSLTGAAGRSLAPSSGPERAVG